MNKKIYEAPSLVALRVENMANFAASGDKDQYIPAGKYGTDDKDLDKDEESNTIFGE